MAKKTAGKSKYTELNHVGLVVRNIDKAMEYLESIGIGPFQVREGQRKFTIPFKGELNGKPSEWKTTISFAQLGGCQLELLEPTEGPQALKESLDATGDGLHHIGFLVDNLDDAIAKGKEDGLKIWTVTQRTNGPRFLYFKPTETCSLAIELRELK